MQSVKRQQHRCNVLTLHRQIVAPTLVRACLNVAGLLGFLLSLWLDSIHMIWHSAGLWKYHARFAQIVPFLCRQIRNFILLVLRQGRPSSSIEEYYTYCPPPPFRRKARGHSIRLSVVRGAWFVVRGSEFIVGTLWAQLLLQFLTNPS